MIAEGWEAATWWMFLDVQYFVNCGEEVDEINRCYNCGNLTYEEMAHGMYREDRKLDIV